MWPDLVLLLGCLMTKTREHFEKIWGAVQAALNDGVKVLIGGDPAVIQVTQGKESYLLRTVGVITEEELKLVNLRPSRLRVPATEESLKEAEARLKGMSGNFCIHCGGAMQRVGACEVCSGCGTSGGCS
jgi:hypothetical protein